MPFYVLETIINTPIFLVHLTHLVHQLYTLYWGSPLLAWVSVIYVSRNLAEDTALQRLESKHTNSQN